MCICLCFVTWRTFGLVSSPFSMQIPRIHSMPSPHAVPSAQGKWRVWQTGWPRVLPVHHSRWHGACMSGHGFEPAPKDSSHCLSRPYDTPGKTSGNASGFSGWSNKQSPAGLNNNTVSCLFPVELQNFPTFYSSFINTSNLHIVFKITLTLLKLHILKSPYCSPFNFLHRFNEQFYP